LHDVFICAGLWDEARVFRGKMMFSQGVKAPLIKSDPSEVIKLTGSELDLYFNKQP
jgi:diaminohydroxyphosphoribosylaminopyrimidine deaminase/5-amino-6-(5-phosphoribosylamino)uracil reductase